MKAAAAAAAGRSSNTHDARSSISSNNDDDDDDEAAAVVAVVVAAAAGVVRAAATASLILLRRRSAHSSRRAWEFPNKVGGSSSVRSVLGRSGADPLLLANKKATDPNQRDIEASFDARVCITEEANANDYQNVRAHSLVHGIACVKQKGVPFRQP
jgi:hypothetical protein